MKTCKCGHTDHQHIYNEGACRPGGIACPCNQFEEKQKYFTKAEVLQQAGGKFIPGAFVQHWEEGALIEDAARFPVSESSFYGKYDKGMAGDVTGKKCLGWTLNQASGHVPCADVTCGKCYQQLPAGTSHITQAVPGCTCPNCAALYKVARSTYAARSEPEQANAECSRITCPDIFNGHSKPCKYAGG